MEIIGLENLFENVRLFVTQTRIKDLVDIFLVWVVVYRVLLLTKRSGAVQILSGLGILAIAYLTSIWMELVTFNWLLEKFFSNLFLIVVILFQAEIRRALAQIGSNPFFTGLASIEDSQIIEELTKGLYSLAQNGLGALVVIEKEIALDYFVEIGIELDSNVRSELLTSIFQGSSPMHDGAVIIRNGRVLFAGCFLPLSKNPVLDKNLGTRHRAALGLTEETDAIVFVVSEENRSVSIVQAGKLQSDVSRADLKARLYEIYGLKMRPAERGAS